MRLREMTDAQLARFLDKLIRDARINVGTVTKPSTDERFTLGAVLEECRDRLERTHA